MNYNQFVDKYGFFLWKKNLKILEKENYPCGFAENKFRDKKYVRIFLNKLYKKGADNIKFLDFENLSFEVHDINWSDVSKVLLKEHYYFSNIKFGKIKRNQNILRITLECS